MILVLLLSLSLSLSPHSIYLTHKQPPSTPLNLATAACISLGPRMAERALKDMLWSTLHGYHLQVTWKKHQSLLQRISKFKEPHENFKGLLGDAANVKLSNSCDNCSLAEYYILSQRSIH